MNDWGAKIFDAASEHYDNIMFVKEPAKRLVANAKIMAGQHVLDVACGTGWATMETAEVIGDAGKVIGIDFSNKLLDLAKDKTAIAGLSNIEYYWGEAEALDFNDGRFDTVICASSIYFFQDIPKALQECHRVLRPGGTVAFSSFGSRFLQPGIKRLGELLSRYDGQPPAAPLFLERTNTPEKCHELLKHAGFVEIDIFIEQLDYHFSDIEDYWREISFSFVRRRLNQLKSSELKRIKVEHLSEIESMLTNQDIFIELPTIFSIAKKLL